MAQCEVWAKLDELLCSLTNHNREWRGMIGTEWERADKARKWREIAKYRAMLEV